MIFLIAIMVGIMTSPLVGDAACAPISRTLRVGMQGEDVRALQKFLNDDVDSMIATTGVGSPGNESTVFGPATLRAVMKFQAANKEQILIPAGVTEPTGIIGKMMRGVVNQYLCANPSLGVEGAEVSTSSSKTSSDPLDTPQNRKRIAELQARSDAIFAENDKKLTDALQSIKQRYAVIDAKMTEATKAIDKVHKMEEVFNALSDPSTAIVPGVKGGVFGLADPLQISVIVPSVAYRGDRIGIIGSGFLENNKLHIADKVIDMEMPNKEGTVSFARLPADLPMGRNTAFVENSKGKSDPVPFFIAEKQTAAPVISSFTPAATGIGKTVTLRGTNFLAKNDIYTSLGVINNVSSSDGTTLTFTVQAEPALVGTDGKLIDKLPYTVLVGNDRGLSGVVQIPME